MFLPHACVVEATSFGNFRWITLILRSQKKKMVQRFLRNGCRPWNVFEAEKIAKLINSRSIAVASYSQRKTHFLEVCSSPYPSPPISLSFFPLPRPWAIYGSLLIWKSTNDRFSNKKWLHIMIFYMAQCISFKENSHFHQDRPHGLLFLFENRPMSDFQIRSGEVWKFCPGSG